MSTGVLKYLLLKFLMVSFFVVPGFRLITDGILTRLGFSAEKLARFSVAVESVILSSFFASEFSLPELSSSFSFFFVVCVSLFELGLLPELVLPASVLPSQACGTGGVFLFNLDI